MKNMFFKGLFALLLLAGTTALAQQTTGDVTKDTDINPGTTVLNGSVRVIDNKGTIKYLQVQNGLTLISNTTSNVTTTTWQLGGELTDDTYIDADGSIFSLDGLKLETGDAATSSTTQSGHDASAGGNTTAVPAGDTGWTLVVRDEQTGEIKKLLATDLIQSGQTYFTVATDGDTVFDLAGTAPAPTGGTIADLTTAAPLPAFAQVSVYRNGAKLLAGVDYTITTPSSVTLVPGTTAPNEWDTLAGDIIEVHYFK